MFATSFSNINVLIFFDDSLTSFRTIDFFFYVVKKKFFCSNLMIIRMFDCMIKMMIIINDFSIELIRA